MSTVLTLVQSAACCRSVSVRTIANHGRDALFYIYAKKSHFSIAGEIAQLVERRKQKVRMSEKLGVRNQVRRVLFWICENWIGGWWDE